MKKSTAVLIMSGVLIAGAAAWAWGPRHGEFGHFGPRRGPLGPLQMLVQGEMGRLTALRSDLDVSREQRDQIHGIVTSYRDSLSPLVRQVVWDRQALRDAVVSESANEPEIRQRAAALGESIADAALLAAAIAQEVRPVFTPEQLEQIEEFALEHDEAVDRCFEKHEDGGLLEE